MCCRKLIDRNIGGISYRFCLACRHLHLVNNLRFRQFRFSQHSGLVARMKPRIFISAVSEEFASLRDHHVDPVLRKQGFEPVAMKTFPTGDGDLLAFLRKEIDSCEGLIQIIGAAYGREPPIVSSEFGRTSYTQYELLYARHKGKRVWIFFAGEHTSGRDRPLEKLDLPPVTFQGDIASYQEERRSLQLAYRGSLVAEALLRHHFDGPTQLENLLYGIKTELETLRVEWRKTESAIVETKSIAKRMQILLVVVLVLVLGLVSIGNHPQWTENPSQAVEIPHVKIGNRVNSVWNERLVSVLAEADDASVKKGDWVVVNEYATVRNGFPTNTARGLIFAKKNATKGVLSPLEVIRASGVQSFTLSSGEEHFWMAFDREIRQPLFSIGKVSCEVIVPARVQNQSVLLKVAAYARTTQGDLAPGDVLAISLERVEGNNQIHSIALREFDPISFTPRFTANKNTPSAQHSDHGIVFEIAQDIRANEGGIFRLTIIRGVKQADGRNTFFPLGIKLNQARTELLVAGDR